MTTSLALRVDLRRHVAAVEESGVAVVSAALDRGTVSRVRDEVGGLPFEVPPPDAHPASSDSDLCRLLEPLDGTPTLRAVRDALVTGVRYAASDDWLSGWRPDEVFVRRYGRTSPGLAAHRDGVRFAWLVATVTIAGSARFLHLDDQREVVGEWVLAPGDLVLLRGAVPGAHHDGGRPLHAVGEPARGPRCSVAFRHNAMVPAARRRPTRRMAAATGDVAAGRVRGLLQGPDRR